MYNGEEEYDKPTRRKKRNKKKNFWKPIKASLLLLANNYEFFLINLFLFLPEFSSNTKNS